MNSPRSMTLPELIKAAVAGDAKAMKQIIDRYWSLLQHECAKYRNQNNPEWSHSDSLQEVSIRIWDKLEQFRHVDHDDVDQIFRGWLRTTAQRVLLNLYRDRNTVKRRPAKGLVSLDETTAQLIKDSFRSDDDPVLQAQKKDDVQKVRRLLEAELGEESRQILQLHFSEGRTLAEIQRSVNLTYEQVRRRYNRALKQLKQAMLESN